ncbi:MAG: hypothetical protein Q8Q60_04855 [Candidatus Chromulinivorax sp.]|nr:hypothetical protein [Candidatus Chromulinivorax sp.]
MKKLSIVFLLLFPCFAQAHVQQPEGLIIHCRPALQQFINFGQDATLLDYESMVTIFSDLPKAYSEQRKLIRNDINSCRKYIRMYAPHSVLYHNVLQELLLLYDYTKKHQECCKAIYFHNQLQQRYQFAFNNPNIVEALEEAPQLHGVEKFKYKSRAYFKNISADIQKTNTFERTLHSKYGVLKAHNYAYQIELIKIRNYVYHHNLYKFETRYF